LLLDTRFFELDLVDEDDDDDDDEAVEAERKKLGSSPLLLFKADTVPATFEDVR
jgi:hypothetical protein